MQHNNHPRIACDCFDNMYILTYCMNPYPQILERFYERTFLLYALHARAPHNISSSYSALYPQKKTYTKKIFEGRDESRNMDMSFLSFCHPQILYQCGTCRTIPFHQIVVGTFKDISLCSVGKKTKENQDPNQEV